MVKRGCPDRENIFISSMEIEKCGFLYYQLTERTIIVFLNSVSSNNLCNLVLTLKREESQILVN